MNILRNFIVIVPTVVGMFLLSYHPLLLQAQTDNLEILDIRVEKQKTITRIKWLTNIAARGQINFGESGDSLPYFVIENTVPAKYHNIIITTPKEKTDYYYKITAYTDSQQVESFVKKFKTDDFNETIPPQISRIKIAYLAGTAAVIEWETDKEASTKIEFDNQKTYGKKIGSEQKTTNHRVIIKNLAPSTAYYLRLYSTDKKQNKSSLHYLNFTTLPNDNIDRQDLKISYLRPTGPNDPYISPHQITINFKTNHYAKGMVELKNGRANVQIHNLDYSLSQTAVFTGLNPASRYTAVISMDDIFGKRIKLDDIVLPTPAGIKILAGFYFPSENQPAAAYCGDGTINQEWEQCDGGASCTAQCQLKQRPMPNDLVLAKVNVEEIRGKECSNITNNVYLGSDKRVIPSGAWFALRRNNVEYLDTDITAYENVSGLAVQRLKNEIRLVLHASKNHCKKHAHGNIEFFNAAAVSLKNDRTGNNTLENGFDGQGVGQYSGINDEVWIKDGDNNHSYFWLTIVTQDDGFYTEWKAPSGRPSHGYNYGFYNNGQNQNNIMVLGTEYSRYTPAVSLLKTADSPAVYAIVNNQRHYISSPTSFNKYGYNWGDIQTVNQKKLNRYPRARLIKSPDNPTIYYLYQRPENKWLKIAIPSPTAFVSYPDNHWGDVITVNQPDIDSYPDAKLIKTALNPTIYYLKNNIKHQISGQVFRQKQFSRPEIVEISRIHLDTYKTGAPWR